MNRRKFIQNTIRSSIAVSATSAVSAAGFSTQLSPAKGASGSHGSDSGQLLLRVVDLDPGEEVRVNLNDGSTAKVKLLGIEEQRDPVFHTLRATLVHIEINGERVELICSSYR